MHKRDTTASRKDKIPKGLNLFQSSKSKDSRNNDKGNASSAVSATANSQQLPQKFDFSMLSNNSNFDVHDC
jgi:hypothetical protein